MKELVVIITFSILVLGCGLISGKFEYFHPLSLPVLNNSIAVDKTKDDVWNILIPAIGKTFFVINNLDKSSGFINISYTGDPEKYIDCGRIFSYFKNVRGEVTYDFPAAQSYKEYYVYDSNLYFVKRKLELDGRMNIIVEKVDSNRTRITTNTKYIVTKTTVAERSEVKSTDTETISFNSGQRGSFSKSQTICQPNGKFEEEVLSLLLNPQ